MMRSMALGPGLALVALVLACAPAAAQMNAGAISLQIAPSARADAMGTAYTAVADDAYATWWNPAGLAFLGESFGSAETGRFAGEIAVTQSQLVPDLADDVEYGFVAITGRLVSRSGLSAGAGISVPYISYGKIPIVKESEGGGSPTTIGSHTPGELASVLGLGLGLMDAIGVGLSVKVFRSDLAPAINDPSFPGMEEGATGTAFALDLGFMYRYNSLPFVEEESSSMRLKGALGAGASVLNLGPDITYIDAGESNPLPRVLKVGVAGKASAFDLVHVLIAADVTKPLVELRDQMIWGAGLELGADLKAMVDFPIGGAVRGGYYSEQEGDIQSWTAGFGLHLLGLGFDWATFPQSSVLDRVNRFSLRLSLAPSDWMLDLD